jgi:crossover junction endodeoxyribonuclease RusA
MIIIVYGIPGPQGSKRYIGHGVMIESSKKVKPWREAVKWAALEVRQQLKQDGLDTTVFGPVTVLMDFTMPRPKSAKPGALPSTRPDLSKLVRSTEDALTEVLAWEDDARVVRCLAQKRYVGEPGSLDSPGAWIRIERMA